MAGSNYPPGSSAHDYESSIGADNEDEICPECGEEKHESDDLCDDCQDALDAEDDGDVIMNGPDRDEWKHEAAAQQRIK